MTQGIQCPHCSKVPEKKCDNNCLTFIKNGFCLHTGYLEAPTDESWIVEFDKMFDLDSYGKSHIVQGKVKAFIASLLQKEREKAYEEGKREKLEDTLLRDSAFAAGKSEAFSLVRKILKKLQDNADYISIKGMGYREAVKEISLELSTLEGK